MRIHPLKRLAGGAPVIGVIVALCAVGWAHTESTTSEKEEVDLNTLMENMGQAHRKLRRQISEPTEVESSLALIATMQKDAALALTMPPSMTDTIPKEQQGKFLLAFKRQMLKLMSGLLDVEEAMLDEDIAKAKVANRKLLQVKRRGHEMFQEEEEE